MPNRPLIGAIAPTRLPGPSQQAMGAVVQFSPRQLFVAGEQGAWYDPSDQTTLFSTHDSTTPGVAVGNPVGKILDKSGRGNHATQSTLAARPVLQVDENGLPYLLFDGIDDCLFTSSINFASTDKMTVWAGVRKLLDARGVLFETGIGSSTGSFAVEAPDAAVPRYLMRLIGNVGSGSVATPSSYPALISNVITLIYDLAAASNLTKMDMRINGADQSMINVSGTVGSGNFGNHPLYVGRRNNNNLQWNGRLYSLIIRGNQSTEAQITRIGTWVNQSMGAY